jgi:RNA polymerase sigma-70 factor (ECF subfamily)
MDRSAPRRCAARTELDDDDAEGTVTDSRGTVTRLLRDWQNGRQGALDEMLPLVYDELRRLAARYMRGERPGHTLQATALVHEAFTRLVDAQITARSRAQFFALACRAMRNVLVDHARARGRVKRGSDPPRVTLDESIVLSAEPDPGLLDLDAALTRFAAQDPRKARTVEMHFFGGLTHEEIAEMLGVSPSTVRGDLRLAKAWLAARLGGEA